MTLKDIFIEVFDAVHVMTCFYVYVAHELHKKVRRVRNYPSVVKGRSPTVNGNSIVWATKFDITTNAYVSFITEFFGKLFRTLPIFHTRTIWVQVSTRTMHHRFDNKLMKQWFSVRIWNTG